MKSVVKEEVSVPSFPRLIRLKLGFIILATSEREHGYTKLYQGTVVNENPYWSIGYHTETWCADESEDFHGEITLKA